MKDPLNFTYPLSPVIRSPREDQMSHPKPGYAYIWQYNVRPEFTGDFEKAYGPEGPWVELFCLAAGHLFGGQMTTFQCRGNTASHISGTVDVVIKQ